MIVPIMLRSPLSQRDPVRCCTRSRPLSQVRVPLRTAGRSGVGYALFIDAAHPAEPEIRIKIMRKTLLALALAAAALTAGTSASQAGYGHHYGYNSYNYGYSYNYQPTYYQPTYYCHTVTVTVWDDYSCSYVYRTKQVCN